MKAKSLGECFAAYAVLCLSLSMMWAQLSRAHPAILGLFLVCAVVSILSLRMPLTLHLQWPKAKPSFMNVAVGAGLCLPTLAYFALTFNQEFPFSGDYDHHMYMAHGLINTFSWILLLVPLSLAVTWWVGKRWPMAWVAWILVALILSTLIPAYEFILRYPAGLYTLAAPLNVFLRFFPNADPMLGLRIMNVLSIPIWLWVLRPALLSKWPDFSAALLSGFFLFQKDWIFFGTNDYLEAWCLVFVFLSLETLVEKDDEPWLAPLLAGLGCMFKEQAIFALGITLVVAAARTRPKMRWYQLGLAAAMALLPFFAYWSARNRSGVFRKVEFANPLENVDSALLLNYVDHIFANLGYGGVAGLFLMLLFLFTGLIVLRGVARLCVAIALLVLIASEALYLVDKLSLEYVGHARFHLLSWPILSIGLVLLWKARPNWHKSLTAMGAVLIVIQLPTLFEFYERATRPDYERNFFERYGAPLFFPIGKLLRQMPNDGSSPNLIISNPTTAHWLPYSLGAGYKRELSHFAKVGLSEVLTCECRPETAVLVLDVFQTIDEPTVRVKSKFSAQEIERCLEAMNRTCSHVLTETAKNGFIAGALGFLGKSPDSETR